MGKYLEALKLCYGGVEKMYETPKPRTDKTDKSPSVSNVSATFRQSEQKNNDSDSVPFTDHEIAEHMIDTEVHRDDRSFVRQQIIGVYGAERLERVNEYLTQFYLGEATVSEPHRKSNAGRRRANTWLRELKQR